MSEEIRRPRPPGATNGESPEKTKRTVEFLIGGEVKSFDRDTVMDDFGVDNIIRVQGTEFPKINPTPGSIYNRFNITDTSNVVGGMYLIAKIEKGGGPGREPILSLDGALIAECLDAKSNLTYDMLTAEHLADSLPGLNDVPSLQEAMVESYGKSRELTREQVIAEGVGITVLKIVGPAPVSNIAR